MRKAGTGGCCWIARKAAAPFSDILTAAGLRSGDYTPPDAATVAQREREAKAKAEKRAAQAKRLWHEAQPIAGTLAETYLRGRGIICEPPPTLRFHPEAWHGPTARSYPAMVAAVQGAGLPAVHRTYPCADGTGKATIDPDKMMLGAVSGSAVRLCEGPSRLVLAEGHRKRLVSAVRSSGCARYGMGRAFDFRPARAAPSGATGAADDRSQWRRASPQRPLLVSPALQRGTWRDDSELQKESQRLRHTSKRTTYVGSYKYVDKSWYLSVRLRTSRLSIAIALHEMEMQALREEFPSRYRPCPATVHLHPDYKSVCEDCWGKTCSKLAARGIDDNRMPLAFKDRSVCGAMTRIGAICQNRVVPGKRKCRLHGGKSTGPKTLAGKQQVGDAQRLRWVQYRILKSRAV